MRIVLRLHSTNSARRIFCFTLDEQKSTITIGSARHCDVCLSNQSFPMVQALHASIITKDRFKARYAIISHSSSEPTKLGRRELGPAEEVALRSGETIQIGDKGPKLSFRITGEGNFLSTLDWRRIFIGLGAGLAGVLIILGFYKFLTRVKSEVPVEQEVVAPNTVTAQPAQTMAKPSLPPPPKILTDSDRMSQNVKDFIAHGGTEVDTPQATPTQSRQDKN